MQWWNFGTDCMMSSPSFASVFQKHSYKLQLVGWLNLIWYQTCSYVNWKVIKILCNKIVIYIKNSMWSKFCVCVYVSVCLCVRACVVCAHARTFIAAWITYHFLFNFWATTFPAWIPCTSINYSFPILRCVFNRYWIFVNILERWIYKDIQMRRFWLFNCHLERK
jgi:hypothetical protein